MGEILSVQHLAFSYAAAKTIQKQVLNDINFELDKKEVICLMGANGCGKTTLLDCILGEHDNYSGTILLDQTDIRERSPKETAQYISYIPQLHDRKFPFSVKEIVSMGSLAHKTMFEKIEDEDYKKAEQALKELGIAHLSDTPYTQISGGELQLTLLARSLVQDTEIILMDEPSAHLDFKNEMIFMHGVIKLIKQKGASALIATHSPNQAFYFELSGINCKVCLMNNGEIVSSGLPSEVLTPQNLREVFDIDAIILSGEKSNKHARVIAPLFTKS